jgi:mono/diheme cytochrome c family protein
MLKSLLVTAAAATLAVSLSFADQSQSKIVIPVNKTAPNNGKEMYKNYCAPCHGEDGKGNGPVASSLKARPSDLTELAKNNNGKFPDTHIVAILQFGADVPSHGSATMPVWGPILGTMNKSNIQDKQLRISNLTRYLQTIQAQ